MVVDAVVWVASVMKLGAKKVIDCPEVGLLLTLSSFILGAVYVLYLGITNQIENQDFRQRALRCAVQKPDAEIVGGYGFDRSYVILVEFCPEMLPEGYDE